MPQRLPSFLSLILKPSVMIGVAVLIGVGLVAYALVSTVATPSGAIATVTRGPITQEVDVSGTVKAAQQADLAFQAGGQIATIKVQVGQHVAAGQTLATLDNASQSAAVALAKANLEVQQAKLASLASGTRPQQLAIDETSVTQARTALSNAVQSAYMTADDAVHVKADQVFTNPRTQNATLSVLVPDATLATKVQNERIALSAVFTAWQRMLATASASLAEQATVSGTDMHQVGAFLDDLSAALAEVQPSGSLTTTALSGYQTSVQAGRVNVSTALAALVAADTAEKSAAGALTLAQAGATQDDLNAQQAAVDAASAALSVAQAALAKTVMTAPIAGTITVQNANPGETVTPGAPLVSLVADGSAEADARVSEADIAKIHVGEKVFATFDSYPGVVFDATVTTVDPAATVENGVASYGVTATFTKPDERLLPGLTANLRAITATKADALIVPTSAVITDGTQKFVYVKGATGATKTPVNVGVESVSGMSEITSGLSVGEQVLAFGASASANQ